MYRSPYTKTALKNWHSEVLNSDFEGPTWTIFDNTTYGYATENAFEFQNLFKDKPNLTVPAFQKPSDTFFK